MKLIRTIYVLITALGVGLGYAVSQQHFFARTTAQYTTWIDQSLVPVLALVWLVGGIALAFLPNEESREEAKA